MTWNSQWEAEEQHIDEMLSQGRITQQEANRQHRELQRAYRDEAEEAAQSAYQREWDNW